MILLCGIPSEPPMRMVAAGLAGIGAPFALFNQRRVAQATLTMAIDDAAISGRLHLGDQEHALESITAVYSRLMNDAFIPELADLPPGAPERLHSGRLHDMLVRWCEVTPARVVNRIAACASNSSKPYQLRRIRACGLLVPDTLVTNDPDAARAFADEHGRVVYKSVSGARSIVQELTPAARARLDHVRHCPILLQRRIAGTNVRVHVVGEAVFATRIETAALDYRYASQQVGEPARLLATSLDDDVADRCVRVTRALGLAFSGIDLMLTPDGAAYCFEVNPCPGFSYYESHTGQPIARELAGYLASATRHQNPFFREVPCQSPS